MFKTNEKGPVEMRQVTSPVVALLVLAACVCAASATTLTVSTLNLAAVGNTGDINLTLDSSLPYGLAGYNVTFTIANQSVATINNVIYPSWTNQSFRLNSTGTNNVKVKVADVKNLVNSTRPLTNINLVSVTVKGVNRGSTTINISVNQLDDDTSQQVSPLVRGGTINVQLPPGNISVNSTPNNAWIFLDSVNTTQRTNATLTLVSVGPHNVKVNLTGYVELTSPVTVQSGQTARVTFILQRPANITINTTPVQGATILFSDVNTGQVTNYSFRLMPYGSYTIKVDKPGWYPQSVGPITINPGQNYNKNFVLVNASNDVPPYGNISITSQPTGARIFIDGNDTQLETSAIYGIAPGKHNVSVTLDRYQTPPNQTVLVKSHETVTANFVLVPIPSVSVKVRIVPRSLNIARTNAYFLAFVKLPDAYNAADVVSSSVICNGASAIRLIRLKAFPHVFAAVFRRGDLVDVTVGDKVKFTVTGTINTKTGRPQFSGSDSIKVFNMPTTGKEDTDDVVKLTDSQIFNSFKPRDF